MEPQVSVPATPTRETAAMRALAIAVFDATVAAVHPAATVPPALPAPGSGRIALFAGGKAAGSMMATAEQHYRDEHGLGPDRMLGLGIARHGYECPTSIVPVVGAGHPVPDEAGLAATARLLALADTVKPEDVAVVLISGGGSANWIAPAGEITLGEKQGLTRHLLRSGAPIHEINALRKHLSRIKGGRLAKRLAGVRLVTLAISDVPGDDPSTIASGPTVPDPTTLADVHAIVARHRLALPPAVATVLADDASETPKPGDPAFARTTFQIVSRPGDGIEAAIRAAEAAGYDVVSLGADVEGEAREVARRHARVALDLRRAGRKAVLLSGGELTVTIAGRGRGGPNQEYALAMAIALGGTDGIAGLAADTDGTDGGRGLPTDPAGAFFDPTTLARARAAGLDPAAMLTDNDSTGFFEAIGDLYAPGPTLTNANDLRILVVHPHAND